jgi:uncharacterized protein DUF4279
MTAHPDSELPIHSVSLFLTSDTLDPRRPTKLLAIQPTFSREPGQDSAAIDEGDFDSPGYWTYEVICRPDMPLDDAIELLLAKVPSDQWIWDELDQIAQLNLVCTLSVGMASLESVGIHPDLIAAMASRHLGLLLRLHSPNG